MDSFCSRRAWRCYLQQSERRWAENISNRVAKHLVPGGEFVDRGAAPVLAHYRLYCTNSAGNSFRTGACFRDRTNPTSFRGMISSFSNSAARRGRMQWFRSTSKIPALLSPVQSPLELPESLVARSAQKSRGVGADPNVSKCLLHRATLVGVVSKPQVLVISLIRSRRMARSVRAGSRAR